MHVVEKGIGGMYAATFPVKIRVIRSSINPFPVVGIVILRPLVTKMRWYRCRILPITSTKCAGDYPDIEFIDQFTFGRVAVDNALLLVVDGIGHVDIATHGSTVRP